MSPLYALLAAALARPVGAQLNYTPAPTPRVESGQSVDWGQGNSAKLNEVFRKVSDGAKGEKWARDSRGVFARAFNMDPTIVTKLIPVNDYFANQSTAYAGQDADGTPAVQVGRAALDATHSEGEMAFLLAHELHHTLVKERKQNCYVAGRQHFASADELVASPEAANYQIDLEHEADSWGQVYMARAGYNPADAADAVRHTQDLGEALGANAAKDQGHSSFSERESRLRSGHDERFEASCPWKSP